MQSLCNKDQINFMQEYTWIIDGEKLKELQRTKLREWIQSDEYYLRISDHKKVPLRLSLMRSPFGGGLTYAIMYIEWERTSNALDGRWSVAVDELEYSYNNVMFYGEDSGTNTT